jgi:hypothetical protein
MMYSLSMLSSPTQSDSVKNGIIVLLSIINRPLKPQLASKVIHKAVKS